jgi:restriction endonuclease S subunit
VKLTKVKLNDICNLITCGVAKRPHYVESGIPFLSARNVKQQKIIWNNFKFISQKTHNELTKHNKPLKGDILYTRVGSYGEAAIIDDDREFSLFVSLTLIKPKHDIVNNKFLVYFLNSPMGKLLAKNNVNSSGVGNLNVGKVRNFEIILPTLREQQRIVNKIDSVFYEIDKIKKNTLEKEKNISLFYENVKNKIFNDIINPEQKKLKDVCEKITDGTHQTPKYFDKGYIFLSSRNVKSKYIDWEKIKYIDEKQHLEMQKRVSPKINDILLAKNGTTGMAAIVNKDIPFDIYVSLALLRSSGELLPEYLLEYVNSKTASKQFSERTKGIGVQNLHLREIREVIIKYPKSKNEQRAIIKKIQSINIAYQEYFLLQEKIIKNLKALTSSILTTELIAQKI